MLIGPTAKKITRVLRVILLKLVDKEKEFVNLQSVYSAIEKLLMFCHSQTSASPCGS
jgi:hypothetical protein